MDAQAKQFLQTFILRVLTVGGLVGIQYLYEAIMPYRFRIGHLLTTSFHPLAYPLPFWLAHLLMVTVLLGPLAWAFGRRGKRLVRYLIITYILSILGPWWMFIIDIFIFPAPRPHR
jgi:hypothetical protein